MALSIAFKEWAVICAALAEGRQALILRKGGIAEDGGVFRPDHDRFLLYPTYFHEQHRGRIKPAFLPLLDEVERSKPAAGIIRFTHFAEVARVVPLTDLNAVLALDEFHGWTAEEVMRRFHYRTPGLFAFAIRVFRLPEQIEVMERPVYVGCKSWVPLDPAIATDGATVVLTDNAFAAPERSA